MYSLIRYGTLIVIALFFIVISIINFIKLKSDKAKKTDAIRNLIIGLGLLLSTVAACFISRT